MKLKDGYKKLIGTSYNGDISQILLSNGGNLGYDISSTANTLVQRNANGQIESSLATGTAPLKVASTTLVENLNANLLDGVHKEGLLTTFENIDDTNHPQSVQLTVGGTTKYLSVNYANNAASVSNKLTLKVNGGTTEGTNLYTYNGSTAKTLDIKAGNNITLTATAGILTIASSYTNTTYTLSGQLSGNTFVTTLTPSSGTPTTATVPAMTAATSSAAGKAGLVPAPAKGQQAYFLRGDGTWVVPTNTWRNIKVNGTQIAGTGTGTYSVDYLSGDGISVTGVAGTSTTKNNTITITNTGVRSVTIGTGDNANKVAVNTGGTTTYLTIPYATYSTHLIGGAQGSIPYQSAADTTTFLAAPTTNGYVLKYNTTDKKPYWAADSDTKNTAGSTNSTSKLFLIGATSQAANPQTYSNSAVFATNGTLTATNFVSGAGVSDFSAGTVKLDTLNIPTASGGTTFGPGTSGQVLKSNGTTVYWASDSNSDTKVTQTITTTNASYRVLFSATADDTTRTEAARKATNLLFNPSSGLLTAGGFVKSGSSDSYVLLGGGGHKALSELGGAISQVYIWGQPFNGTANVDGTLHLKASGNSHTQGMRIYQNGTGYAGILLGDSSLTATTGTSTNSWFISNNNNGLFSISRGGYLPTDPISFGFDSTNWIVNGGDACFTGSNNQYGFTYLGNSAIGFNRNTSTGEVLNSGHAGGQINYSYTYKGIEFGTMTSTGSYSIRALISDNGNVGIGTVSPAYKLDVNGNTRVSGVFRVYPGDATLAIYAATSRYTEYGTEGIAIQTTFDGEDPISSTYPSLYPDRGVLQLQPRGGNIAIGQATATSYKLEINGSVYSNNWIRSSSGFYIENYGVHYTFNPAANGVGEYYSGSNNEFNISTSYTNRNFYFNYRAPAHGQAVNQYVWNAGDPNSFADHRLGVIVSGYKVSSRVATWLYLTTPGHTGSPAWNIGVDDTTDNSYLYFKYNYSDPLYCCVRHDGVMFALHFYESSDIALKTNIKSIDSDDNIPILREFDWIESGKHSYGLIAQELEEQGYDYLVEKSNDRKTVNYSAALSLIVGKLQVKIKELEKQIETLKNKN